MNKETRIEAISRSSSGEDVLAGRYVDIREITREWNERNSAPCPI